MLKPVEAVLQLEWFIPNLLEGGADRGRSAADFFRNRYFTGNFYRGGKKSWGWEYFLTKKATANDASMGGGGYFWGEDETVLSCVLRRSVFISIGIHVELLSWLDINKRSMVKMRCSWCINEPFHSNVKGNCSISVCLSTGKLWNGNKRNDIE